ncbi:MAG: RuBisCO large subunit C-terminal-like domain-containing protein [Promethearchaeota archaeon]
MMDDAWYIPIESLENFKENSDAIILAVQISYKSDSAEDLHTGLIELAKETSSGTWVDISTVTDESRRADAWIMHEYLLGSGLGGIGYIGIPPDNWDLSGGFNNLPANVMGNYFGLGALRRARLLDLYIPPGIVREFPGPRYGVDGIYKLMGGMKRMIVGSIVKPKMGLNPVEWAQVAENVYWAGDLVKDDENLCNQVFCPWCERFTEVMTRKQKVMDRTGEEKIYVHNITTKDILGRAGEVHDLAEELSTSNYAFMVDGIIAGLNSVHLLREQEDHVAPIYIHRAMHAAMTRSNDFGISFLVFTKLFRLAGADFLHTGTYGAGKMGEQEDLHEVLMDDAPERLPLELIDSTAYLNRALTRDWAHLKPTLPMASGGLYPGALPKIRRFNEAIGNGYKIGCNAGGGIHGHPDGTRDGARAMRLMAELLEMDDYQALQTPDARKKYIQDKAKQQGYEPLKKALDKDGWILKL